MSEAYQCDRCGKLRDGSPHTFIAVGDGLPRYRRGPGADEVEVRVNAMQSYDGTYDICPKCRGDFEEWLNRD